MCPEAPEWFYTFSEDYDIFVSNTIFAGEAGDLHGKAKA